MPDPLSFLIPGVDLSALPLVNSSCGTVQGATTSDFDNLVRGAQPATGIGFVISQASAPDTATYPILKNFLWRRTQGAPPYQVLEYNPNTFSWEIVSPCPIDGACITDHSLALTKVKITGNTPNYLVVVNATSDGITLSTITGLLVAGTVPLSALQIPLNTPAGSVLTVTGTQQVGFAPINIAELIASLGPGAIKLSQVKKDTAGTAGHYIGLDSDGQSLIAIAPPSIPQLLPTPVPADASKLLQVNNTGTGYVLVNISTVFPALANYKIETSARTSMPVGVGTSTIAHSLGAVPAFAKLYLYCITADVIWSVGDVVPAERLVQITNSGAQPGEVLFISHLAASAIKVTASYTLGGSNNIGLYRTDNNIFAAIDKTKWNFFFILQRA